MLGKGEVFTQEASGIIQAELDAKGLSGIEPVNGFGVGHGAVRRVCRVDEGFSSHIVCLIRVLMGGVFSEIKE